jgi:hypothetical protein
MREPLYIETSVIGYLTARSTKNLIIAGNIETTRDWWQNRRNDFVLYISQVVLVDILTAVKLTVIPKPHDLGFCFFPLRGSAPALTDLLCSGLMVALQTDTASPAAKIFLLALISRSWCVPQSGQSHSRTFNGIFSAIYPQLLHRLELGNHLSRVC